MVKFTKAAAIATVGGLLGIVGIAASHINREQDQIQYITASPFSIQNPADAYNFAGKGLLSGSLICLTYLGLRGQIREQP